MKTNAERIAELSPEKRELFKRLLGKKEPDQPGLTITARRRDNGALPLSFAQQRLWFQDQLEPVTAYYNLPKAVRLHGVLDLSALERSFAELVRRHETLRTTFRVVDEQPAQIISPAPAPGLPFFDLSHLDVAGREAEVARLAEEEARLPFDLQTGPLLRLRVLRLAEEEHVLLLTMHHIVSDAWSMGILVKEVVTLYSAYSQGQPSPLPDLPVQYADYAIWQREYLTGELLEQQLDYWRKQLKGVAALELPRDRPRRSERSYRVANAGFKLTGELTQSLRKLSERAGATLYMTLLAAYQTLLYRYTNQRDISVGTPIANRNRAEIEGLIGFLVNTLVMRTDFSGDPTFSQLLGRVKETALDAYANQDVPFERLVEELQPERALSHSPLFQVLFTLQNAPAAKATVPGFELKVFERFFQFARFDLSLVIEDVDEGVGGLLAGNLDLFDPERLHRFVEHYELLLKSIVADPEQKISQLPILSDAERRKLLVEWNETEREYGPASTLSELFEAQAERSGEAVAVVFEGEQLTYAELNRRANQLAHYLRAQGVTVDDIIGVLMERSLEMVVALLGILKAGAAYLPLDPNYPPERLSFMLEDARLRWVISHETVAAMLPALRSESAPINLLLLDTEWATVAAQPRTVTGVRPAPDNLAYVLYTSGSTGLPKGVMISQRALINFLTSMQQAPGIKATDTLLAVTTLSFDIAGLELYLPLLNGARLVLASRETALDGRQLARLIGNCNATIMQATPATWRLLFEAQWQGNKQLKILCGGEALSAELASRLLAHGASLWNLYGPTETTIWSTLKQVETAGNGIVEIGRPIANTQLFVLNPSLQPAPVGVDGELYIGGDGLARGYLDRPELTAERFVPHPYATRAGERLYRTGDVVRWREQGELEFIGRVDGQVKVRGFRIELGEVEAALRRQEQVREAVVISSAAATGENRLIAYVLTEPETTLTTSGLRAGLRALLPEYMIPAAFELLDEFPLTPSGKIDQRALQARQVEVEAGDASVPARTPAEEIVAAIWAEVLGRETIGVHDNFFELGGHSLLATQVISRVRDAFGQEVPLRSLFGQPTVAGLTHSIEQAQRAGYGLSAPAIVRVSRDAQLPLSFAQQRLWFLDQMEPGNSSYNLPAAVRLRGVLNIEVLERTLSEVVRRHEVLRTRFTAIDGEPVQVIDAAAPFRLEVVDLSLLDEEEREAEMRRLAQVEANLPFDLAHGPLLRVSLIRLGAEEHVALVTMHHIVSDAWSIGIFIREVATLYKAFTAGEESPLDELEIQYADFAHWQRRWLQGEVLDAQLDYWRTELADAPTVIDLPIDKPRPPVQTYRGAYHPLQLSTELSAQLRDLSRRHGSTLFMTLLSAFDILLCRYAGQEQVLVGSPIANRNRSETEALIGFFVNTLVLRGDVRGNPSFSELLRRVRETSLSAYAHQDLPFERLVEELQPERDMSRSPLFQVTFTWQNAPSEALELPGLSLSRVESAGDTAKYELMLLLGEGDGEITGVMEYNRDLFEASTVERLVASYERVLQAVIADAEQRVLQIELLSAAERQQIVAGWNETSREYLGPLTLPRLFEAQAARRSEAAALVFAGEQLSYAELDRRSNQLAHHLLSLGVSPDSLVAVCLDRSLELFIALLAILKAGAAYLPLDPSYPLARLSFMLAETGAPLLLTTETLADELPTQWTPPLLLDADWDLIALNSDETLPETVVDADQLAYVMYTSGSTGTPKGVAVTHGGVRRLVTSPNYVRLDQEQTLLQLAPLTFDASTLEVWGALLNGGRLVVMPPGAPTLDEISRVIVDEGVTTLWLTAGLFHLMVDEQLEDLSRVEQLLAGGDVLSVPHVEKYLAAISNSNRRLINGYGPTENTTFTCCHVMNANASLNGSVPIGRPITNTQVYVLDAEMQVVPVGVVGELYIGGAGLARGYFNQPELTAERFVPHPHSAEAGERLYRTGDMVRWHESGELEFIGRLDGQVKIRGFRIEVGEIEAALAAHAGVREAVVLVREDERGDKRLAAYVVTKAESEVSAGELKDYLREQLPEYMQVQWVVEVAEMPLTANGKVDRRALQALEVEIERGEAVQARTPAEEILAAIFAEVLGRETVSVHDNFFELGGHSLLATQVISRVRDAFGQEVALRTLFEQPTVAGLAREIEAGGLGAGLQAPPLERVERAERLPLSFAQQRLWFLDQLEPDSSFYHIRMALRLNGVLNVEALERTLSEVVRRHEVLRTHFISIDGEPVQVIEPPAPIKLAVLDLSALEEEAREAEVRRLGKVEMGLPFNLLRGPLLRVSLMRLGAEEHVIFVTMHHIVSDAWSIGVFVNETATLYKAFSAGEESPLEELPVQYADFAHWQRGWLQGEVLAAQLDYWREQLAGAPTVIDLPIDKPRPPVQTYRGTHHPVELSAELSAQLRDLSRHHGSTLFMTLLSAFNILLCRYAGQDQVLIGTPIANRNRSETESLIGFFVNTLVLRGDVRGNPSFRELLRRVRETALGAYAHQDLPFEKLVEELQPARDMSRSPLFQVMLALQNAPGGTLELPGLTPSSVSLGGEVAKFDLGLDLDEKNGHISGAVEYNIDLFETATIVRLNDHFQTLLQSIVADVERPIGALSLLSAAEEAQLLFEWNDEPVSLDPHRFIHGLFETQAALNPQAIAVVSEHEQLTYDQLNQRANQLAHYLQSRGVGPEVVVGICVERSPDMLVALLGTLKSGAAYLPLDPAYPKDRLSLMIEDTQARVLLTHERLRPLVSGYDAKVICLDTDWETIAPEPDGNPSRNLLSLANQAFIIYTSGSTGKPKGVMLTHGNLVNYIQTIRDTCQLNSADRVLQFFSISFDAFAEEVYGALTSGATLVLRTDEMLSSPQVFLRQCRELQITLLDLPTAYWHELTAGSTAEDWALERLRLVIVGGEMALVPRVVTWRKLAGEQIQLHNGYGPTETTIAATWYIPPAQIDELTFASAGLPIGRPLRNLQAYILDKHLQPVPIGVSGEIHLGGAGLARGYLNNPALTAERFIPHPFSRQAGACLYKTGDVGRYLPNGDLIVTGRTDQQVKIRGFRVELGEVETAIMRHPAIKECVVVAQAEASGSKRLIAYVVPEQDPAPSTSELRGYLKGNLPEYMIPASFTMLDAMPLTPNGKIDRKALPAPDQGRSTLFGDYVAPRSAVEQILARIWAELLQVERVGLNDNFFDLGGHSLLATRLVARLRSVLSIELPLRAVFEFPTLVDLSETVLQQEGQRARIEKTAEVLLELEQLSEGEVGQMLEEVSVSTSERGAR